MRRLILLLIPLIVLTALGVFLWSRQGTPDASGKVHASLYEGATGTWDAQMKVSPFRTQDIDGQTVGSSTQLTLEWQKPTKTYNHFVITITDPVSGYTRSESGEHDRVSLDPDALQPDTQYVFALQACLDRRCEKWLVAQDEYRGTAAPEVWSKDEPPVVLNP